MKSIIGLFKKALFVIALCAFLVPATTHASFLGSIKNGLQSLGAQIVNIKDQLAGSAVGSLEKTREVPVRSTVVITSLKNDLGEGVAGGFTRDAVAIKKLLLEKSLRGSTTTGVPLSVDLKINGSDTPAAVVDRSKMTATWTTTGASICFAAGHNAPTWDKSTVWPQVAITPGTGSQDLMAALAFNGNMSDLRSMTQLTIMLQCFGEDGSNIVDQVVVPVVAAPVVPVKPVRTISTEIPTKPITIPVKPGVTPVTPTCAINSFTATPSTISVGQTSTITWKTTGCKMYDVQMVGPNGSTDAGWQNISADTKTFTFGPATTDDVGVTQITLLAGVRASSTSAVKQTIPLTVINSSPSLDTTPRIMYWQGKVNQHVDVNGAWQTDPDGVSGAEFNKLNYCKKWFPNTTSVQEGYKSETITTWHERTNINNWTATKMSDKCVQGSTTGASSITVTSPNGGDSYIDGQQITVKWKSVKVPSSSKVAIMLQLYDKNNNDIGGYALADGTSINDGQETVTLPTIAFLKSLCSSNPGFCNADFGLHYKVLIGAYDETGTYIVDYSNNLFTINPKSITLPSTCGVNSAPSIILLSPNGGEVYQAGQQVTVKWKTCNVPVNVPIMISTEQKQVNNPFNMVFSSSGYTSVNDGSEEIILPTKTQYSNMEYGKNFVIAVGFDDPIGQKVDRSDDTFTIDSTGISLPSGCTSNSGYSSTTGQPCTTTVSGGRPIANISRLLGLTDKGDDVIKLQNRLTTEGVYSGPISGYYGQLTKAAVAKFQQKYGLSPIGVVGIKTLAILNK